MKFLTTGEKVKKLRIQLNLTQEDLQTENVTRGLISMIETNKRDITYATAVKLVDKLNEKAEDLDVILNIDEAYLMRSPREDAEVYCMNKLKNEDITQEEITEILKLSDEYDLLEVRANSLCKIGEIYAKEKDFKKASDNYNKAIEIYKGIKREDKIGYVYLNLGRCNAKNLKYDVAIAYYNLCDYYCRNYSDINTEKICLYNLANNYKKIGQIDLALENIEKYLKVANEKDSYYYYAQNTKARCYEVKCEYDTVIDIYKSMLNKISDSTNPILGYVYNNLGLAYCYKNDFKESMNYFKLAEKTLNETDKSLLSHTIIERSEVLLKQNLIGEAIETIELGLKYAKQYNDLEYLLNGNYKLADIYEKLEEKEKLERVYLKIVDYLSINNDKYRISLIYNELALLYLKQRKLELCEKYLVLSKKLK